MKNRRGFTLIELLIVIAIIAILSAVFLPQLRGGQSKARDAARIAVVNDIVVALEGLIDDAGGIILESPGNCFPPVGVGDVSAAIVNRMKAVPKAQKADLDNLCTDNGYFYRSFTGNVTNKGYAVAVQVEHKEAANVKYNDLTDQIKGGVGGAGATVGDDLTKVVARLGEPGPGYDTPPFFYMVVK